MIVMKPGLQKGIKWVSVNFCLVKISFYPGHRIYYIFMEYQTAQYLTDHNKFIANVLLGEVISIQYSRQPWAGQG